MANAILQAHPLSSLPLESGLSLVFECEDPFLMPLYRFETLTQGTEPGELRGYLFGLYDMHRAAVYAGE